MARVSLGACLLLIAACADKPEHSLPNVQPPIGERRDPLVAAAAKLDLNGDCRATRGAGCKSGICLQAGPEQFHCSKECRTDADCGGPMFECAQVAPESDRGWFCVRARAGVSRFGVDAGVSDAGVP